MPYTLLYLTSEGGLTGKGIPNRLLSLKVSNPTEKIMGLLSNKIDRQELKRGDHIYCWRQAFIYAHHGIYVGNGKVIHFTQGPAGQEKGFILSSSAPKFPDGPCPRCGDNSAGLKGVIISCIDCFLSGDELNLFEYGVSKTYFLAKVRGGTCTLARSEPLDDVLYRAIFLLENGFGVYDVFKNNCEDFAIYCKTGLLVVHSTRAGQSGQATSFEAAAGGIFSLIACLSPRPLRAGLAAVGGGVYYNYKRLASDIGVRSDVAKVPVESLVLE